MDTVFFIASKLVWLLISPDSLLLLLLLAGLALLYLGKFKAARIVLSLPVLAALLIALLPLDEWFAYPLESRFAPAPELPEAVTGIIVLGGTVQPRTSEDWQQPQLGDSAERLFAFASLARAFPQAQLVFTGGNGELRGPELREADVARTVFLDLGLDPSRIVFERNSRNTFENARNSKEMVQPGPGQTWILITSAAHMSRSVGIFCQQDWPVIPFPVDYDTSPGNLLRVEFDFADNLELLSSTLREWVGLLAYFLTGKTSALLPVPCEPGSAAPAAARQTETSNINPKFEY